MKTLFSVLGNIALTFLVILIFGYGFVFFELKILLKPNPELFGYIFYMQKDDKMADDFYKNDIILIKDGAEFNEGDIIFILDANNKYKLRRVVKKGDDVATTKCNICLNEEEQVDNIKIRGRAIGKIMLIGHIINFFKNKAVIVITAAFGFACLIISQYLIYEPRKVKKEEKEINI